MSIDTSKSISSVTYNGVNIPLAGGGSDFKPCPQDLNSITEPGVYCGDSNVTYANTPNGTLSLYFVIQTINGDFYTQTALIWEYGDPNSAMKVWTRDGSSSSYGAWQEVTTTIFETVPYDLSEPVSHGIYLGDIDENINGPSGSFSALNLMSARGICVGDFIFGSLDDPTQWRVERWWNAGMGWQKVNPTESPASLSLANSQELILRSSTPDSTKQFRITVDDSGALSAAEITA